MVVYSVESAKLSSKRHSAVRIAYTSIFSIQSCNQQPKLHAFAEEEKHMPINPIDILSQTFLILIKCQFRL